MQKQNKLIDFTQTLCPRAWGFTTKCLGCSGFGICDLQDFERHGPTPQKAQKEAVKGHKDPQEALKFQAPNLPEALTDRRLGQELVKKMPRRRWLGPSEVITAHREKRVSSTQGGVFAGRMGDAGMGPESKGASVHG